jgi:hypothetical protein
VGATTEAATIVVTDLVGPTALRSRLGERVADEPRREHDTARLGLGGDRVNGRRQLDEARRWVETIGLPRLLPRIEDIGAALRD